LCSAYTPAMGLCQKAAVLRLHQPATCPAIWTHVTSARRISAMGKAHALGRLVSVTLATLVHTVRCNAASLLAACLCAARLRCMHPVASFEQWSAVLQHSVTSILACIAVTRRIWPHPMCVRVCVCVRPPAQSHLQQCKQCDVQHQTPIKDAIKFADTSLQLHVCVNVMYSHYATAHTAVTCVSCFGAGGSNLQQWCCGCTAAVLSVRCARQQCHLL